MAARTLLRLGWPQRRLLAEALLLISLASAAVALLQLRTVCRMIPRRAPRRRAGAEEIRRIRWALAATARRVPWRAVCFQQGLAAHWMLTRRGCASTLHYGVGKKSDGALGAHVWVRSSENDVVGCEEAKDYALLLTFGD